MVKTKLSFTKKILSALFSLLFVFAASAALILPSVNTAYAASEQVAEFHFWQIGKGSGTRTDNGVDFQYSGIKANTDSNITIGANSTVTITVSESAINTNGITSGAFYIYASGISYTWKRGSTTLKSGDISSFVQVSETSISGSGDLVLSLTNSGSSDVTGVHFESPNYTLYAAPKRSVSISAGTGVKSVYMSTSSTATSGDSSGTEYADGTTVYGFAKLDKGYSAKSGWTLVSGTANTENAIYRVGSKKISSSQKSFGTISADATSYTISYTLNGGTLPSGYPANYTITTNTFSLSNPTKTGYTFSGWTGSNGSTPQTSVSIAKGSTGNKSYTANWTANSYTVTLNKNNGTGGSNSVSATYGSAMPSATMPTRTGYTFSGYFDSNNVKYYNANGTSAKNWDKAGTATLTAKWQINQYPVSCPASAEHASFFLSSSDNATSGVSSGNFDYNSTVYFYVVADEGYYAPDGSSWQKIATSGDKIVYRANSLTVGTDTNEFAAENPQIGADIVANATGYNGAFDKASHTITVSVTTPASDYVVKYKVGSGDYSTTNPQYTNVCNVTVEYKVTADGYYPFFGGATVVITQQENVSYTTAPAKNEGLIYNGVAQALLTAGTSNYGTVQYKVGDEGEWADTVPQVQNVGEYLVYFRVPADANQVGISESSFTVSIAEVDKDELNDIIATVDAYYDTIKDDYSLIAAVLDGHRQQIYNDYYVNPNVTETQVAAAVIALNGYLDDAKKSVSEAKINAIGTVSYSADSKALIDDARNYFDNVLNDTQRELVDIDKVAVLVAAEELYNAVDSVVNQINNIGQHVDTQAFRNKVSDARTAFNNLTEKQQNLVPEDVLKLLADYEAVSEVVNEINAIGTPRDTDSFRNSVTDAREAFDNLTDDQKDLFPAKSEKILTDDEAIIPVIDIINNIGAVSHTSECKVRIDAARDAFNDLTDDQEEVFPESIKNILINAEKAYNAMDKIAKIGQLSNNNNCKQRISRARKYYDGLTDVQKALVNSNYLKQLTDSEAAFRVVEMFNEVGEIDYTAEYKEKLDGVRAAYEDLTSAQKSLFPKDVLNALESCEKAYDAMDKIVSIGEIENTEECESKIKEARNFYNSLTKSQKKLVKPEILKQLTDLEAAFAVIEKVNGIGDIECTTDSQDKIRRVRAAYESLSDDQKSIFPKDVLNALENAEKAYDAMDKIASVGKIENTEECESKIKDAREFYSGLSDEQKGLVKPEILKQLTDSEAAFATIEEYNAIGSIEYTADSKAKIEKARGEYESLSDDQKSIFPKDVLNALVDNEQAYIAMDEIHAIGKVEFSMDSKAKIEKARAAYEVLTANQKALVRNYGELTHDEEVYLNVKVVADKINAIGDVKLSESSHSAISDARKPYDGLSDEEKSLIKDYYDTLTAAEDKYAELVHKNKVKIALFIGLGCAAVVALIIIFILLKRKKDKDEEQK